MNDHFNKLTPAEAERLAILSEEMGEVQKAIGKILRHGYAAVNPDRPRQTQVTNRGQLENELGDVYCIIGMMVAAGDVIEDDIQLYASAKKIKIKQYLHHQEPYAGL